MSGERLSAKQQSQRAILDAVASQPVPGADSARERLEQLLPADKPRELDERNLADVVAAAEHEQEPTPFFDALAHARAAQTRSFVDAVRGRRPQPPPDPSAPPSGFDGGARESPPRPPESHEQTLMRVMRRGGEADVGANF
jgi:hypothetical protein